MPGIPNGIITQSPFMGDGLLTVLKSANFKLGKPGALTDEKSPSHITVLLFKRYLTPETKAADRIPPRETNPGIVIDDSIPDILVVADAAKDNSPLGSK